MIPWRTIALALIASLAVSIAGLGVTSVPILLIYLVNDIQIELILGIVGAMGTLGSLLDRGYKMIRRWFYNDHQEH